MALSPDIPAKYLACYEDPRATPGFIADAYPLERDDEAAVPAGVDEAKTRFKAVYARRNACLLTLAHLPPGHPDRPPLMEQIISLTEAIDHLEDYYAPVGLVAEPVMDDSMFTRELVFTHAQLPRPKAEPLESSFSLYIPIPLEDFQGEESEHGA